MKVAAILCALSCVLVLFQNLRLSVLRFKLINEKLPESSRIKWPTNTYAWSLQFEQYRRTYPDGRLNRQILVTGIMFIGLGMLAALLFMLSQLTGEKLPPRHPAIIALRQDSCLTPVLCFGSWPGAPR